MYFFKYIFCFCSEITSINLDGNKLKLKLFTIHTSLIHKTPILVYMMGVLHKNDILPSFPDGNSNVLLSRCTSGRSCMYSAAGLLPAWHGGRLYGNTNNKRLETGTCSAHPSLPVVRRHHTQGTATCSSEACTIACMYANKQTNKQTNTNTNTQRKQRYRSPCDKAFKTFE